MKVRLKQDCNFDKTTANINGNVMTIGHAWIEVPSMAFVTSDMEIEGQEDIVLLKEQPKIVVEKPKDIVKPVIYSKPKKK